MSPGKSPASESRTFTLRPERPYSLARTAERLVRFDDLLERYDAQTGVLTRLLQVGRRLIRVEVSQRGTPARADLRIRLTGAGARDPAVRQRAEEYVRRALGAGQNVTEFYRALRKDPVLAPSLRRDRGLRVAGNGTVFEALVTSVLAQQVNLTFAYSIRREMTLTYGRSLRLGSERYWIFPTPQKLAAVPPAELRAMRISGAKTRAILSAAAAFTSAAFGEAALSAKTDAELLEQLTALHGVGPWTAEQVLIHGLGRNDVFPASDLGVIKYLAQGLLGRTQVATEKEMREFAEAWRPYRSLALVYAYAELAARRSD